MLIFDYKCPQCGILQEMSVRTSSEIVTCHRCEFVMEKQIPAPKGFVTGYNYKNGYSKKEGSN
jgi:ribosomal protein L37AE/L43A